MNTDKHRFQWHGRETVPQLFFSVFSVSSVVSVFDFLRIHPCSSVFICGLLFISSVSIGGFLLLNRRGPWRSRDPGPARYIQRPPSAVSGHGVSGAGPSRGTPATAAGSSANAGFCTGPRSSPGASSSTSRGGPALSTGSPDKWTGHGRSPHPGNRGG